MPVVPVTVEDVLVDHVALVCVDLFGKCSASAVGASRFVGSREWRQRAHHAHLCHPALRPAHLLLLVCERTDKDGPGALDYADNFTPSTPPGQDLLSGVGITQGSALSKYTAPGTPREQIPARSAASALTVSSAVTHL